MTPSQTPRQSLTLSRPAHDRPSKYALVIAFIAVFGFLTRCSPLFASSQEKILHSFGGDDGAFPSTSLIRDAAGNLYGTTAGGGLSTPECDDSSYLGCGTVFELMPAGGTWTRTILHRFTGSPDGSRPYQFAPGSDGWPATQFETQAAVLKLRSHEPGRSER
jgi:hypothetical protein